MYIHVCAPWFTQDKIFVYGQPCMYMVGFTNANNKEYKHYTHLKHMINRGVHLGSIKSTSVTELFLNKNIIREHKNTASTAKYLQFKHVSFGTMELSINHR